MSLEINFLDYELEQIVPEGQTKEERQFGLVQYDPEENENKEEENDNNIEIQETYKDILTDIINENEIHDDMIKDFFIDNLFNKTENKTEMKNIIDNMKKAIERGEFKEFIEKNNKTELVQKKDDKYYQVSTLSSQLDNNEVASINLGDCEAKLRNQSNISPDEDLIIFKINHIIIWR